MRLQDWLKLPILLHSPPRIFHSPHKTLLDLKCLMKKHIGVVALAKRMLAAQHPTVGCLLYTNKVGAASIRSGAESNMLLCIFQGECVVLTFKVFNTSQSQREYPLKNSAT